MPEEMATVHTVWGMWADEDVVELLGAVDGETHERYPEALREIVVKAEGTVGARNVRRLDLRVPWSTVTGLFDVPTVDAAGEGDEGAMRWDGSLESIQAICAWANDPKDVSDPWVSFVIGDGVASEVQCDTVEGIVAVKPGDWIVRNAEREFSVARPVSVSTGGDERGTDAFGKRLSVTVGVRYADLEAECTECGALPVVLPFENGDAWCTQCAIDALTDRMEEEASPPTPHRRTER